MVGFVGFFVIVVVCLFFPISVGVPDSCVLTMYLILLNLSYRTTVTKDVHMCSE